LLRARHSGIELHTVSSVRHYSLSGREVDLSLRFDRSPQGREVCRVVGAISYACFRAKDTGGSDLPWVGYGEELRGSVVERRIEERRDGQAFAIRVANEGAAYQAIRTGIGRGLIPETFGERDTKLIRVSGPDAEIVRELKLLYHPDIGRVARVAAVIAWIEEIIPQPTDAVAH
jgi:DNA-binding transcriptional LysR family regulator